jgi:hypothetical protein
MQNLLRFCRELEQRKVNYRLLTVRDDALMVAVALPGSRWEIEFFADDHVEIERFDSRGVEDGSTDVAELLRLLQADE